MRIRKREVITIIVIIMIIKPKTLMVVCIGDRGAYLPTPTRMGQSGVAVTLIARSFIGSVP